MCFPQLLTKKENLPSFMKASPSFSLKNRRLNRMVSKWGRSCSTHTSNWTVEAFFWFTILQRDEKRRQNGGKRVWYKNRVCGKEKIYFSFKKMLILALESVNFSKLQFYSIYFRLYQGIILLINNIHFVLKLWSMNSADVLVKFYPSKTYATLPTFIWFLMNISNMRFHVSYWVKHFATNMTCYFTSIISIFFFFEMFFFVFL